MTSFGWIAEHYRFALGWLGRFRVRPKRFLAITLISLLATTFLPDLEWSHFRLGVSPAYSQASVIANQAGGSFQDAAGNTTPIQSNQTTIGRATPATSGATITKTADRGAAEPGDVVTYRVRITNGTAISTTGPVTFTDQLPLGLQLIASSITASPTAPTSVTAGNRSFTLTFPALASGQSITVAYSAEVTSDAFRGSGRNVVQAVLPGIGTVTATFQLAIRPGILSDCGTIVGRVFVDKNFDGEQQAGEPGVPNAVIFMDDGNRIITDPDGLFSLINVLSGNRVGTLDLASLPGYTLAPNLYWLADNSVSRLVRLEPGGLARMNFAVTPTFGEGQS